MIKAKNEPQYSLWQFSPLDSALISMVNSSSWLFDQMLDIEQLKESLSQVLDNYPVFCGRMLSANSIATCNAGVTFEIAQQKSYSCKDIEARWIIPEQLKVSYNFAKFKKGRFPVMCIKLSLLADGCLLHVAVNHVCADGASLYRFVSDWAKVYSGENIDPVLFNQNLFPSPKHNKQELAERLSTLHWCPVGFKDLFPMLVDRFRNKTKIAPPVFVCYESLNALRTQYDMDQKVGNHALLCALLSDRLFDKNVPGSDSYTVASVVDLRGRAVYPEAFVGNAVANLSSDRFHVGKGIKETATLINSNLKRQLGNRKALEEYFLLYAEAMVLKLPFVPFDLSGTYGKGLRCLLVNDFSRFKVYDSCFGSCKPVKVYPNDLPDNIKIWPGNKQENGIYIFLRGYLSKKLKTFF